MPRTRSSSVKVSGAKAPRKSAEAPVTGTPKAGGSSKRSRSCGGNPVVVQPTPKWQRPITGFAKGVETVVKEETDKEEEEEDVPLSKKLKLSAGDKENVENEAEMAQTSEEGATPGKEEGMSLIEKEASKEKKAINEMGDASKEIAEAFKVEVKAVKKMEEASMKIVKAWDDEEEAARKMLQACKDEVKASKEYASASKDMNLAKKKEEMAYTKIMKASKEIREANKEDKKSNEAIEERKEANKAEEDSDETAPPPIVEFPKSPIKENGDSTYEEEVNISSTDDEGSAGYESRPNIIIPETTDEDEDDDSVPVKVATTTIVEVVPQDWDESD